MITTDQCQQWKMMCWEAPWTSPLMPYVSLYFCSIKNNINIFSYFSYFSYISYISYFSYFSTFPTFPTFPTFLHSYLLLATCYFLLTYLPIIGEFTDAPGIPIPKLWPWLQHRQPDYNRVLFSRPVIEASLQDGRPNNTSALVSIVGLVWADSLQRVPASSQLGIWQGNLQNQVLKFQLNIEIHCKKNSLLPLFWQSKKELSSVRNEWISSKIIYYNL